jgi:hypothetical protein
MPTRLIDFDSLWTSEKLANCKSSTRVEYAWFYGLAGPDGSFELNIRAIHSRISAIRPRLTLRRVEQVLAEFEQRGLLFTWWNNGKHYGHWTGSDRPGRLPKPSERHRYKKFAPDVPKEELIAYESRFSRDAVATTSPLGVGVGVGLERGLIGDGFGIGEVAPQARGFGAISTPNAALPQVPAAPKAKPETLPASERSKTTNSAKPSRGSLFCKYCDQYFSEGEFQKHNCDAKTAGGWECIRCHSTFKRFAELKKHFLGCRAPTR